MSKIRARRATHQTLPADPPHLGLVLAALVLAGITVALVAWFYAYTVFRLPL